MPLNVLSFTGSVIDDNYRGDSWSDVTTPSVRSIARKSNEAAASLLLMSFSSEDIPQVNCCLPGLNQVRASRCFSGTLANNVTPLPTTIITGEQS